MASQQFTVEVNSVIVVEEPKCLDFKLLEVSGRIVAVIHRCISWASVGTMLTISLNVIYI